MSRSPSMTSYGNDDLSSPDPLAASVNDESSHSSIAFARRQPAPKWPSTATTTNTGRPARTSSFSCEAVQSSPFRTVSEQNLSPWKIRVTVEAQPEDADVESNAPLIKERARKTKIPLQPESPPAEQSNISAQGRKLRSNSTKNKRSGTPVSDRRNSSRSRRQSVTDLDIIPLGDDSEEDDWLKQKKSPRKRRNSRKSTSKANTARQSDSPSKPSKSNPRSSSFEVRPDTDVENSDASMEQGDIMAESQSPELRKINLNQVSVRPRALSTKSNVENDYENKDTVVSEKMRTSVQQQMEVRKVSINSALSYPTPSPTSSRHGDSDDVRGAPDDRTLPKQHENDGFDTILESEGFTMIDLDTLPSVKRSLSSPADDGPNSGLHPSDIDECKTQPLIAEPSGRAKSYLAASNPSATRDSVSYPVIRPDESELSSTVPSSPPASKKDQALLKVPSSSTGAGRKVTPLPYSSPKLPSPPRHNVRRTPHHQHRASAGAVFAGIALQEVVSPDHPTESAPVVKQETPSNHAGVNENGALFVGFDCGTQRELRAGLRFGEELAKRLALHPVDRPTSFKAKSLASDKVSDVKVPVISGQQCREQVWRGENLVQHTPVHTVSSTEQSDKVSTVHTPPNPAEKHPEHSIIDTQARREREWQLEREAVSQEIQNASESQVIVIDSDDEEEQPISTADRPEVAYPDIEAEADDETDIWLVEAKNSSSPESVAQACTNSLFTRREQIKQRQRAQEVVSRARRSLIPSPWKRGEDVHAPAEQSTFLSTDAEASSLMFYNVPESKIRFGAGEIKRQQLRNRRNSGKFDVDLMAGTPKKAVDNRIEDSSDMVASEEDGVEEDGPVVLNLSSPESQRGATTADDNLDMEDSTNDISRSIVSPHSSPRPIKIPVNFNDSSISMSTPPPPLDLPRAQRRDWGETRDDSPERPPTPRSAMKGSRHTFNQGLGFAGPDATNVIRKVVFSQRSRGVDVDGQESSFSMRSSNDDSFEDSVGLQLNRELRAIETEARQNDDGQPALPARDNESQRTASAETEARDDFSAANPSRGWVNWIWGSKQNSDRDSQTKEQFDVDQPEVPIKPTTSSRGPVKSREQSHDSGWEKTKASIPSSTEMSRTTEAKTHSIPSYLTPPSYPSDPLRSVKKPLALNGNFSNTHFRTLHIIYRKSLRPKFHPPPRAMIRPEIWALRGAEMVVDESANGLVKGEFAWTVGDGECEVLERFMQECEYSHGWYKGRKVRADAADEITWSWSVEQLAEWLCRIVVGEVVREEEKKAKGQ
ncbi:uncharacterized protein Z519_01218 [Cladophialophora bantiana CBS 173.52]|uniref:Uncharacterized protein n=1 Tax=Cladophialophora bantiana (strain ATCC 10958 / CBS 173.52 / CDC B-1940 / NIH 8579) TaxID=1442370 RepID=A0A0D2ILF9_CLAB1|nr:uncharacterized protein Z519_01218 [Cladophialophora bantiana CBS 173.52]KIW97634.1 hypothetical protein Z519_01218 [Cladophialophora bantiana CBS 173.52]